VQKRQLKRAASEGRFDLQHWGWGVLAGGVLTGRLSATLHSHPRSAGISAGGLNARQRVGQSGMTPRQQLASVASSPR